MKAYISISCHFIWFSVGNGPHGEGGTVFVALISIAVINPHIVTITVIISLILRK